MMSGYSFIQLSKSTLYHIFKHFLKGTYISAHLSIPLTLSMPRLSVNIGTWCIFASVPFSGIERVKEQSKDDHTTRLRVHIKVFCDDKTYDFTGKSYKIQTGFFMHNTRSP